MERSATPVLADTTDRRVMTAITVADLLASALRDGPTDLVSVELRRAHQIVTRLLRELGISDEMPAA